jgi:hypothetical protein
MSRKRDDTEALLDPRRPVEQELEASVAHGFTLAAVGDCISPRPLAPLLKRDEAFAGVVELLRRAGVAFGNLETSILDVRALRAAPRTEDDWCLMAPPAVARDLAELGLRRCSLAPTTMRWTGARRGCGRRVGTSTPRSSCMPGAGTSSRPHARPGTSRRSALAALAALRRRGRPSIELLQERDPPSLRVKVRSDWSGDGSGYPSRRPCRSASPGIDAKSMSSP